MAAPQPLHIFRKDLIHLWPETLVVLALFVAFAWSAPSGWQHSPYAAFAPILADFLKALMPIAWMVLISRLIHDESLVGDRQFWTSRPYHWFSLFLAKLLYLAVFLYLPFFLMQMFLLKHAGLYPTTALGPLFHNLLLLTVIVVVPLTALAAVTGTFAKMLLSTLGAIIYIVILSVAYGFISFQHMPPPALAPVLTGIFIVLPLAALLYQYSTRKTMISRIALAATPLLIFLLLLITPAAALIRHAYPVANGSSDPKLSTIPDEFNPKEPKAGQLFTFRGQAQLQIPFAVAGVDEKSNYAISGASYTVDTPGVHYASPYVAAGSAINAGAPYGIVMVPMPLEIFNKIKSTPADIHLSLATEHQKAEPATTWKATLLPFAVPGNGVCSYSSEDPNAAPVCRYPFKAPDLNHVSGPMAIGSCEGPNAQPVQGQANLGGQPSLLDFDPVFTVPMDMRPRQQVPPGVTLLVCPGTPLSFVEAKTDGKARFEVDEKHMTLDNFALRKPTAAEARTQEQTQQSPE